MNLTGKLDTLVSSFNTELRRVYDTLAPQKETKVNLRPKQPWYDQEIKMLMQEDLLGTKDEIGSSNVHLYNSNLHLDLVPQEILVMAPELQEDLLGTKVKRVTLTLVIYIF